MTDFGAEEHLRAIRLLMERATIYRAISAPTALVGGLLSVGLAAAMLVWQAGDGSRNVDARPPVLPGLAARARPDWSSP